MTCLACLGFRGRALYFQDTLGKLPFMSHGVGQACWKKALAAMKREIMQEKVCDLFQPRLSRLQCTAVTLSSSIGATLQNQTFLSRSMSIGAYYASRFLAIQIQLQLYLLLYREHVEVLVKQTGEDISTWRGGL